jgi:integrase/recombinase XerC
MEQTKASSSIATAIENYIKGVKLTRSQNTALTYGKALKEFKKNLVEAEIDPQTSSAELLTEDLISKFVVHLKTLAPATEQLYVGAVAGFYKYLAAEGLAEINWPRVELTIKQNSRKASSHLPQFPTNEIERVLDFVLDITSFSSTFENEGENEKLRVMRDRAFLITLADTGLRVHEACSLQCGDVDWNRDIAVFVGKGDKKDIVRFTTRTTHALKDYLSIRAELDGASGKQLTALPLFARHDKGAGKKIKPITPTTGRNIVAERVRQVLGNEADGHITPHSFRHYFVSTILRASGNLKLAQALARHENIQITQRYAHINDDELDKGYYEIFEKKSNG